MAEFEQINEQLLEAEIVDRKNQLYKLYGALGRAYYNEYINDESAFAHGTIERISAIRQEIEDIKNQIKTAGTFSKCPSCGEDIPVNFAFCNYCGTKIEIVPAFIEEEQAEPEEAAEEILEETAGEEAQAVSIEEVDEQLEAAEESEETAEPEAVISETEEVAEPAQEERAEAVTEEEAEKEIISESAVPETEEVPAETASAEPEELPAESSEIEEAETEAEITAEPDVQDDEALADMDVPVCEQTDEAAQTIAAAEPYYEQTGEIEEITQTSFGEESLKEEKEDNSFACPACGTILEEGYLFCTKCGVRIADVMPVQPEPEETIPEPEGEVIPESEPAAEEPAPVSEPEIPKVNLCPRCGAEIEDGYAFCISCGMKLK